MEGVSGSLEVGEQGPVMQLLSLLRCVFVPVLAAADLLWLRGWLQRNVCLGACCIKALYQVCNVKDTKKK